MENDKPTPKKKRTFYEVHVPWGDGLREGSSISIQRSMSYFGERADFKPFLSVPIKELEARLKASQAEEIKVVDQLQEIAKAWDEHGAQTLLLKKAIEYLKVPEVKHTANEWRQQKDGTWEISNLVYKMTFQIIKAGDEWKLSWQVSYMAPGLAYGYWEYTRTPRGRIDYESNKKYKTMEGAQRYIQMKFDQYTHYFDTLSPPIPAEAKEMFCVNGQLLQGYSIARTEVKKKAVPLNELLDCLEDSDVIETAPQNLVPAAPAQEPGMTPTAPPGSKAASPPPPPKPDRATAPKKPHRPKRPAMAR